MKQNSTKFLVALIAIIIIAGTIMIFVKGLDFELQYQDAKRVQLSLGKEFDKRDMRAITNEIFGKQQLMIQEIEVYKDSACITTTEITEDQKNDLVAKVNEKYETEIKAEDVKIEEVAHTRGRDIVKPYLVPFAVVTAIVIVGMLIRYYKLNSLEVLTQSVGIMVLAQAVLLGIMAITRVPVGKFTIPLVMFVYMISTYICTAKFEEELDVILEKEKKNKKKK